MTKYIVNTSFVSTALSCYAGETVDIKDKKIAADLTKAGYITQQKRHDKQDKPR